MPDVCLVTPTRDRPQAFALCVRWMSRQTFRGTVQWIVVDDGDAPVDEPLLKDGAAWPIFGWKIDYVRREPSQAVSTLQDNMLAALARVDAPKLLVIEDDEHYAPIYVEEMVWRLGRADMLGESNARYYNVRERRWGIMSNSKHASLCRTGLTQALYGALEKAARDAKQEGDPFIDLRLWGANKDDANIPGPPTQKNAHQYMWGRVAVHLKQPQKKPQAETGFSSLAPSNSVRTLFAARGISIGIKGMPGRGGLGRAHAQRAFANADPAWQKLIEWIGPDAQPYIELAEASGWKALP